MEPWPAILSPDQRLDGRLPTQVAMTSRGTCLLQGTPAEMGKVPITRPSLHQAGVPCFLQGKTRFVERRQDRVLRMDLVRTFDCARSCNRDGVLVHRASFRNDQIIPTFIVPLAFVQVRPLGQAKRSSNKNQLRFAS